MSVISASGSGYSSAAPGPTPAGSGNWGDLGLLASTGPGGFALQNATPNILLWRAPQDGQLHRVFLVVFKQITVIETGGGVAFNNSGKVGTTIFGGGAGVGFQPGTGVPGLVLQPGDLAALGQSSALTAGASVVWAEFWGS